MNSLSQKFKTFCLATAVTLAGGAIFNVDAAAEDTSYMKDVQGMVFKGSLSSFFPTGNKAADLKYKMAKARDLPGGAGWALNIQTIEGQEPWSQGMLVKTEQDVAEGDVLLASFMMRNAESMTGECLVNFVFQGGPPQYSKSAMVQVSAGRDWTQVYLPFAARGDYAAGEAMTGYHLSLADQTLEIADFKVMNFGPDYDVSTLPNSDVAYEGREPDAPWRDVAAERIEEIRKGDLSIQVVDADGQAVPDAKVSVEMTRHAFPFGTAVAVSKILLDDEDGDRYRQELTNNFNAGVFESAMKWNNYGTGTPAQIAESMDWLTEHDITMRGHVLMWPSWRWVDPEILPLREDPKQFRQAIEDRVTGMVTTYKENIQDWDVVNEAYSNNDILKMYGDEIMVDWFKLAHEANPNAALYVNDNGMLTAGGRLTKQMQHYIDMIQMLVDQGAPVSGIGMQGHFAVTLTSPEKVWETLDRFAHFDMPIQVTEFDIKNDDPQLQADFLRDFLTACFAHPTIEGFYIWGFWEGQHWRPEAALFNQDWSVRKHGKVWQDLIYNQWWTTESGQTDGKGKLNVRGFVGDYKVTVTGLDGKETTTTVKLTHDGSDLTITLDR